MYVPRSAFACKQPCPVKPSDEANACSLLPYPIACFTGETFGVDFQGPGRMTMDPDTAINAIATRAHYSPPWADVSLIGIAGSSGSGKSTLSRAIVNKLNLPWVVILSMDSFYKSLDAEASRKAFLNEYDFDSPDVSSVLLHFVQAGISDILISRPGY